MALVTVAAPVIPDIVDGPVAESVNAEGSAVPPPVFTTFLVNVRIGFLVFVNVQLMTAPGAVPPAAMSTKPDARLLVVLPVPVPVHAMPVST